MGSWRFYSLCTIDKYWIYFDTAVEIKSSLDVFMAVSLNMAEDLLYFIGCH